MTKRDWAVLGVRLLALWLLVRAVMGLVHAVWFWLMFDSDYPSRGVIVGSSFLQSGIPLLIGCLLWFLAGGLARRILPGDAGEPAKPALDKVLM